MTNLAVPRELMRAIASTHTQLHHHGSDVTGPGWTMHMHPSTWITVLRDSEFVQYVQRVVDEGVYTGQAVPVASSSGQTFAGILVALDAKLPRGLVEIRYSTLHSVPVS